MSENTPLERARDYIRTVKDDPSISEEHRVSLDRALMLLLHEGIVRDERQEEVLAVLMDLQKLFNKYFGATWENMIMTMPTEINIIMERFEKLGMRDIRSCLHTIRQKMIEADSVELIETIDMNMALDRINFQIVHLYHEHL